MSKTKSQYVCSNCGGIQMKWMGKCPDCSEWNTLQEVEVRTPEKGRSVMPTAAGAAVPTPLPQITLDNLDRLPVKMAELNRVLGGGIVPGACVLVGGDPGIGKCVTGDTRVLNPVTGAFAPITQWATQQKEILALDPQTYRFVPHPILAFLEQGRQPIVEVITRLGHRLRCTPNHPLLTTTGWQAVNTLAPGARIAIPRALPFFGDDPLTEPEIKIVAYVLSDGSATSQVTVTNALPEIESDLAEIALHFGMRLRVYAKGKSQAKQYRFVIPAGEREEARKLVAAALKKVQKESLLSWAEWARRAEVDYAMLNVWRRGEASPSVEELMQLATAAQVSFDQLGYSAQQIAQMQTPLARFLTTMGLRHLSASTKFVPERIFALPKASLALFLRVLFSCDGSVYTQKAGQPGISYSTISRRLAEDVQHLLLRFGFVSKLRTKRTLVNGNKYVAYEIQLLGVGEVQRFLTEIGIWGRSEAQQRIQALPKPTLASTHFDTIPTGELFWQELQYATGGLTARQISAQAKVTLRNRRYERPLTRQMVTAICSRFPSPFLQRIAQSDVYWDEIEAIETAGEELVYDLSVPHYANFVANDLIIHNSTLLLQVASEIAQSAGPVLYVSAEESAHQIKRRADRLQIKSDKLFVYSEIEVESILDHAANMRPKLMIVDSIQAIYSSGSQSAAGTVSQVRDCAAALLRLGKQNHIPIFLVGHVTKEGSIAGPRVLEHMVDVVLQLEGERFHAYRLLRSVKNRFGSTNEVGIFEMGEVGMTEVRNPSELFLAERLPNSPGSAIAVSMEGTRPLLVEVQALSSRTSFSQPRRTANGIDMNRLLLISAVLSTRVGLDLSEHDIFVNVVGGMHIDEPAVDLAVAVAIASSYRNKPVAADLAIVGEVGLSGELRSVGQLPRRLHEAVELGFKRALTPRSVLQRKGDGAPAGIEVLGARTLRDAVEMALIQ